MIEWDCGYSDGPHLFPDDWRFGGANGKHPGADARWIARNYVYYDEKLAEIFTTASPLCDEEAIDWFTKVAEIGPTFNPAYIAVRGHPMQSGEFSEEQMYMLPVKYDAATDTAFDLAQK